MSFQSGDFQARGFHLAAGIGFEVIPTVATAQAGANAGIMVGQEFRDCNFFQQILSNVS